MTIVDEDKVGQCYPSYCCVEHHQIPLCLFVQKMKHSKLAEGIEQSYVQNPQLLPPGVDTDSVSSLLQPSTLGQVLDMQHTDMN